MYFYDKISQLFYEDIDHHKELSSLVNQYFIKSNDASQDFSLQQKTKTVVKIISESEVSMKHVVNWVADKTVNELILRLEQMILTMRLDSASVTVSVTASNTALQNITVMFTTDLSSDQCFYCWCEEHWWVYCSDMQVSITWDNIHLNEQQQICLDSSVSNALKLRMYSDRSQKKSVKTALQKCQNHELSL